MEITTTGEVALNNVEKGDSIKQKRILKKVAHQNAKTYPPQMPNCSSTERRNQPATQNELQATVQRNNTNQNLRTSPKKKKLMKQKWADSDEDIFEMKRAQHHYNLEQRTALKEFIAYENPDLTYHEIVSKPFSRNRKIADNFQLISYQQAPVKNLLVCKGCKQVLIRYPRSTTNLLRHLKRHSSIGGATKEKKCSCLDLTRTE